MSHRSTLIDIVQPILTEERRLDLWSRDIALLAMMTYEIEQSQDGLLTVPYSTIQALSSRIDLLESKDPQKAERRLSESVTRLLTAGCLTKADIVRLRLSADAGYQVTSLGESVAEWHVTQSRFSGEPLTATFTAFLKQLASIVDSAEAARTAEDWHCDVIAQMQHALRDMLVSMHRHQNALDRKHEEMRSFIPTLLTANNEESISQCKEQLAQVIKTIEDLQEAVLGSTSRAFSLINRIADLAKSHNPKGFELVHDDLIRRMQTISTWITQRAIDWMKHHTVVHNFLRAVLRVDRQRRITDALKLSIAGMPGWTVEVADEPSFYKMRTNLCRESIAKKPPFLAKQVDGVERKFDDVKHDEIPDLLLRYLHADLGKGDASASLLLTSIVPALLDDLRMATYFPWLLEIMLQSGDLDPATRNWIAITPHIEIEELRVTAK